VRLLLLTGCRKSEILPLRWEWLGFKRGCLRLPDSKTGAKVVPLAAAASELLNELPRASAHILSAAKSAGHYTGLQKDWERVRVQAGLPEVRVHDLRHSSASFAVANGHALFMVGRALGQKQARTTEGYAHLAQIPARAFADRNAERIAAAVTGGSAGAEMCRSRSAASLERFPPPPVRQTQYYALLAMGARGAGRSTLRAVAAAAGESSLTVYIIGFGDGCGDIVPHCHRRSRRGRLQRGAIRLPRRPCVAVARVEVRNAGYRCRRAIEHSIRSI
jgi:hypothetical protein